MVAAVGVGILATLIALVMTAGNIAAKTGAAKLWGMIAALAFTATAGGTILLAIGSKPSAPVGSGSADSKQSTQAENLQPAPSAEVAKTDTAKGDTASPGSVVESTSDPIASGQFLLDIIQALRDGQPIAQDYLKLLPANLPQPPGDSGKSPAASFSSQAAPVNQEHRLMEQPIFSSKSFYSEPVTSGAIGNAQVANVLPVNHSQTVGQPVSGSQPIVSVPAELSPDSQIMRILNHDLSEIRDSFQKQYAQPLSQSNTDDLYAYGDYITEVHYNSNQKADWVKYQLPVLSPKNMTRSYWETSFCKQAGIPVAKDGKPTHEPTYKSGNDESWVGVYAGVNSIVLHIDMDTNQGYILARS